MTLLERDREKFQEGREEGREEGIEQGMLEASKQMAKKLLQKGMSIEEIVALTELSRDEVETISRTI